MNVIPKVFHSPLPHPRGFPWLRSHIIPRLFLRDFISVLAYSFVLRVTHATSYLFTTLSTEVVDVICISLPVPLSSGGERGSEKSAHSSTSPSADGDHKVSSAEMHVKRFKRASEVSSALSSSFSTSSFPSHPIRSRFHCSFRYPSSS